MAGEIEEPFRLNFQADLLHSGSISFGRFESESLSWERRSIFSHNRYLEEVERYSKPGSVTEKKAYFEAEFRRKALLKQSSSESQDEGDFPTSRNSNLQDLEYSGNGNENGELESPYSSNPLEYNKETETQQHEKEDVEGVYEDNGNVSSHGGFFDQSSHTSGHDEDQDTISQECESQNCEFLPAVTVESPVSVPELVKIDEKHDSETDNVKGNTEEIMVDVASKAKDSSFICQTLEKDDDSTLCESKKMFSPKVKPAPEKRPTRATSKTQVNFDRSQKHVSNEATKCSIKPKTIESKVKKTEKKSARPASQEVNVKMSKQEVNVKAVKPHSSLSKKSLPTVNRTISSSKSGFSFKTDQRAENRKEFYMKIAEKMHAKEAEITQVEAKTQEKQAAEIKQFRRSLNFKATPMPSFYTESTRALDSRKAKTPNQARPSSQSMATRHNKNAPSNTRPSSSSNRIRGSQSVAKSHVVEKKKDTSVKKQMAS